MQLGFGPRAISTLRLTFLGLMLKLPGWRDCASEPHTAMLRDCALLPVDEALCARLCAITWPEDLITCSLVDLGLYSVLDCSLA